MTRSDLALAALASAAVPGMKPVSVAGIRPGDSDRELEIQRAVVHDATGRMWVVHAPLTAVAGARLQRHDELVRQLPRHVPFKVPAAVGYASVGRDGPAVVYPYIEGSPLDLGRLPAGQGLASAVGRAVAAIHNIPRSVFEAQDVPVLDAAGVRQRAISEVDRAAETGRVPTGLLARWEEAFEAAPLWQFATTPVHGSFDGDSLLVAFTDDRDAGTGRVVAVLNWDEACVGDPAADLAELFVHTSPQAWESVLDSYSLARAQRPDPYLHARARLASELRSLRGLARGVEDGREESVRRIVEALRRMDRLTEEDDSLVPATARHRGGGPVPPPAEGSVDGGGDDRATEGSVDAPRFDDEEWEDLPAAVDGDDLTIEVPQVDHGAQPDHGLDEVAPEVDDAPDVHDAPDAEDGPDTGDEPVVSALEGDVEDVEPMPTEPETADTPQLETTEPETAGTDTADAKTVDHDLDTPELDTPDLDTPDVGSAGASTEDADPEDVSPEHDMEDDPAAEGQDASVDELEDMAEEERLHELYGMPDPDEPGKR